MAKVSSKSKIVIPLGVSENLIVLAFLIALLIILASSSFSLETTSTVVSENLTVSAIDSEIKFSPFKFLLNHLTSLYL